MDDSNQETIKNPSKAGFIPYYIDLDGEIKMLFMTPSDPFYGGPDPQIAKGGIDSNDSALSTALREAAEELGLKESNIELDTLHLIGSDHPEPSREYSLTTYAAMVNDPTDFLTPHYETGSTHWLTLAEFEKVGRQCHRAIVRKLVRLIRLRSS